MSSNVFFIWYPSHDPRLGTGGDHCTSPFTWSIRLDLIFGWLHLSLQKLERDHRQMLYFSWSSDKLLTEPLLRSSVKGEEQICWVLDAKRNSSESSSSSVSPSLTVYDIFKWVSGIKCKSQQLQKAVFATRGCPSLLGDQSVWILLHIFRPASSSGRFTSNLANADYIQIILQIMPEI